MKNKRILLLSFFLLLSSCKKEEERIYETKVVDLTMFDKAQTTYIDKDGIEKDLNLNTLYSNSLNPHLNPLSNQNVLVVPFTFQKDENDVNDTVNADDELLNRIKVSFTASEEEINTLGGVISVSDFYKKSSYNKCNFNVDVLDTYITYNSTPNAFRVNSNSSGGIYAASYITDTYKEEYVKENHGILGNNAKPLSYYDSDNDGFIDLLWIVYTYPYSSDYSNFWWAYVTYTQENSGTVENPNVKTLGFASSEFLNSDSSLNGYDSHTFIHETGHTLGLTDYYDYNKRWAPLGGVDYMDQNIGDHCAYSKFALGWTSPYVIKEEDLINNNVEVNLKSFTETGESILLASNDYNNTAFDEYLLIELVTPTSISKRDYLNGYNGIQGYSKPGIRITHIDSRVYSTNQDTYLTNRNQIGREAKAVRVNNSYLGRLGVGIDGDYFEVSSNFKKLTNPFSLISIIESNVSSVNANNSSSYLANNNSLFKEGDHFYLEKNNTSSIWAKTYMPSMSSLWNKSKTIDYYEKNKQYYHIDVNVKCNYTLDVLKVDEKSATLKIGVNR